MGGRKLLVIGLDGADKQALIGGINQGRMPEVADIAQQGSISTLKAPIPPLTPVSMASILTGDSPGEHGVYGFEDDGEYVDYRSIKSDTIFDILDKEGGDIISVNVPMTSPLPDSTNIAVSGFPISDSELAKPYPVRKKLREIDYQVEPSEFKEGEDQFIDEVFSLAEKRFRVALDLIDERWDVFFLMFTGDARLQHFVEDEETIMEFYAKIDDYIGDLRSRIEEELEILVVSDHGFSDLKTQFDLANWLSEEGYMDSSLESDASRLYGRIEERPEDHAYPAGAYMSGIYAEEEIREELVEKLEELKYDGKKVFRDVFLSQELYGENSGPDIIPVPRRGFSHVAGYLDQVFEDEPSEKRVPDTEGVLISSSRLSIDKPRSEDLKDMILDRLEIREAETVDFRAV